MALHVPDNLDQAIDYVLNKSGWKGIIQGSKNENEFIINCHASLGQWMRNNWGFWAEDSNLCFWFWSLGIFHPDDMSSIILTSAWRKEHDKDIDLLKQVKDLKDYWDLWKDEDPGDDDIE